MLNLNFKILYILWMFIAWVHLLKDSGYQESGCSIGLDLDR